MKKIVSLLLAMTMLLCSLPIFANAKEEERPLSKPQIEILKNNVLLFKYLAERGIDNLEEYEKVNANLFPNLSNATSLEAQATTAECYGPILNLLVRFELNNDAELEAKLLAFKDKMCPPITDFNSEEVQIARLKGLEYVYKTIYSYPEKFDEICNKYNSFVGSPTTNPSIKVQVAATESYAYIIEYSARNPDAKELLLKASEKLVPKITALDSEEVQIARSKVLATLYEQSARQPEAINDLKSIVLDNLGPKPSNPSVKVQAAAAESYDKLIEGSARQPEFKDTLLDLAHTLGPDITALSSDEVQIARCKVLAYLYEAAARQPEFKEELKKILLDNLGPKPSNPSVKVQAAAAESYGKLIEASARQPELKDSILELANTLGPDITALSSDEVQIARCRVLASLYESVARQPEAYEELKKIVLDALGSTKPSNASAVVQKAAAESFGKLVQAINRQPEAKDLLLGLKDELSPAITNFNSEEVQLGRVKAFAVLYDKYSHPIESAPIFKELLGGIVDINNYKVTYKINDNIYGAPYYVYVGNTITEPDNPTLPNAGFLYWVKENDAFDFNTPITSDVVLTAKWLYCEPVIKNLKKVPETLKGTSFNTIKSIQSQLRKIAKESMHPTYARMSKSIYYDVSLKILENGVARIPTEAELNSMKNVTILLPYPKGTNPKDHNFVVTHMITKHINGFKPGDIETPAVTETEDGILVTLSSLSPICITYYDDIPLTDDNLAATSLIYLFGAVASVSALVFIKRRKKVIPEL